jgi:hypothetical protein
MSQLSKMILIPYFEINGTISYPENYTRFNSAKRVTYKDVDYYLCEYTGSNSVQLESGVSTYANYVIDFPPIVEVEFSLSTSLAAVGQEITYIVRTDPTINKPDAIIPLSITDRNGQHVGNIGLVFENGIAQGAVSFSKTGDYYITEEAINFHADMLGTTIKIKGVLPMVRVTGTAGSTVI